MTLQGQWSNCGGTALPRPTSCILGDLFLKDLREEKGREGARKKERGRSGRERRAFPLF